MTWRTVVISSNAKLDLKMGYMVIRTSEIRKIHLSEISVVIIESTATSITAMLMCELIRRKIKVVLCDETHEPYGEITPLYGSHDSTEKIRTQIAWKESTKEKIWAEIVHCKIINQAKLAEYYDYERASIIREFADNIEPGDPSNREGHAAKVYFNTIFGPGFSRKASCSTNIHLNYGYSILLSAVNREISALGYITQLGIHHDNVYNYFNLGSDIMEPIRPLIDSIVLDLDDEVTTQSKHQLANVLNSQVYIDGKHHYLNNAIRIYVKSVTDAISNNNPHLIKFCEYERKSNAADRLL